ncbi:MAG: CinA family nicotinamide mononucleotide deamidase-related protein [Anaerolineaceae bacterium]|nr:CinA family nicotinamide mononucleotide deamidase-related protein [Anaerolineaceae bacterium]
MPVAEIIAIGTELLLGEIQDTNTRYLARTLRDYGIDLYRSTIIGDNMQRVAAAINEALERADIIITTGGLGPTVDDPTRDAVALAFQVETVYLPELWEQIENRFQRFNHIPSENNRRQAYIPSGAIPVENPVGTAPSFIVEQGNKCVISLPGVPKEMEYLTQNAVIPYLTRHYDLHDLIKARVLHVIGLGESTVDDRIGDLETIKNPTVGLLAKAGQVDVRITAKAASEAEADRMIALIENDIRSRIGDFIFGADEETIEQALIAKLNGTRQTAAFYLTGLDHQILKTRFESFGTERVCVFDANTAEKPAKPYNFVVELTLKPIGPKHEITITSLVKGERVISDRSFGGPPELAPTWAINAALSHLYRLLIQV